jgi:hypothetical protein
MVSRRPSNGIVIEWRCESPPQLLNIGPGRIDRKIGGSSSSARWPAMSSTNIPDKAHLHHIVLQKGLLSGLLTFLFGDAARLDTVNLSLLHFDQNVRHLLDFGRVIVGAEQRYGVAAAVTQRW